MFNDDTPQGVQDKDGGTDNGDAVISANRTLSTLARKSRKTEGPLASGRQCITWEYTRVAYLDNPMVIRLRNTNPGLPADTTAVLPVAVLKCNWVDRPDE
ncbi:hypothetical protein BDV59DRAFT_178669 [Aspergillus ambiguus]|uniref:endonuclease/exonuclease/phosphatase family protein n=1 Tax=Aspergillus ambiguus TaxID=176160 RepID=UPI003CCCA225